MKKLSVVLMGMIFGGLAINAQAANIAFNPGSVALTIEPGSSAETNLVVTADSMAPYNIYLNVGAIVQGNLPPGWLIPANISLATRNGGVSSSAMRFIVNVPANTPSGKYTALLPPRVLRTTEAVSSQGVTVTVDVPSQKKCAGLPGFENVKVGPENIWAPKSRDVEVDVSGTVIVAAGCEVSGTYTMESNNGPVSGELSIDPDGNFAQKITVTVSKRGRVWQAKTYNGELVVVDAEGNSVTQGFFVKVGHDWGKKKGRKQAWQNSWKSRWQKYWQRSK